MEALLNRYRNLTVLLVAILAQLILLAYQVKTNQDVRMIRIWAITAVTPIANVLEVVRQHTIGLAEDYFVLVNVREQNRKLNDEMGRLKLENQFLRTELQTADRVKLLSAFQERTPSRTLAARIIGNATGANSRVVFVDRGSVNGVMRGMAVVTPDGIVGKVIASYPTASQVQLVTDENFAAGVISQKHRVHGTIKGKGQNKPIVDYVQNEETVEQGELFFTSGDDRVFPKGLPVGPVTAVRPGKNFKEIYVMPAAFQQGEFEEVLIIIEGVHQGIPAPTAVPSPEIKLMNPPPPDGTEEISKSPDLRTSLNTEADKMLERYRKIGEMQNHKFGEALPGAKAPDFNLDPNPKPQQPAASAQAVPTQPKPVAPGVPGQANAGSQAPPVTAAKPPSGAPAGTPAKLPNGTPASAGNTGVPSAAGVKPPAVGTSGTSTAAKPRTATSGTGPNATGSAPTTAVKPPAAKPAVRPGTAPGGTPTNVTAPRPSTGTTAENTEQRPVTAAPKPTQQPSVVPTETAKPPAPKPRPREEAPATLPIP